MWLSEDCGGNRRRPGLPDLGLWEAFLLVDSLVLLGVRRPAWMLAVACEIFGGVGRAKLLRLADAFLASGA